MVLWDRKRFDIDTLNGYISSIKLKDEAVS